MRKRWASSYHRHASALDRAVSVIVEAMDRFEKSFPVHERQEAMAKLREGVKQRRENPEAQSIPAKIQRVPPAGSKVEVPGLPPGFVYLEDVCLEQVVNLGMATGWATANPVLSGMRIGPDGRLIVIRDAFLEGCGKVNKVLT